jgi:hypothetical protein
MQTPMVITVIFLRTSVSICAIRLLNVTLLISHGQRSYGSNIDLWHEISDYGELMYMIY